MFPKLKRELSSETSISVTEIYPIFFKQGKKKKRAQVNLHSINIFVKTNSVFLLEIILYKHFYVEQACSTFTLKLQLMIFCFNSM